MKPRKSLATSRLLGGLGDVGRGGHPDGRAGLLRVSPGMAKKPMSLTGSGELVGNRGQRKRQHRDSGRPSFGEQIQAWSNLSWSRSPAATSPSRSLPAGSQSRPLPRVLWRTWPGWRCIRRQSRDRRPRRCSSQRARTVGKSRLSPNVAITGAIPAALIASLLAANSAQVVGTDRPRSA